MIAKTPLPWPKPKISPIPENTALSAYLQTSVQSTRTLPYLLIYTALQNTALSAYIHNPQEHCPICLSTQSTRTLCTKCPICLSTQPFRTLCTKCLICLYTQPFRTLPYLLIYTILQNTVHKVPYLLIYTILQNTSQSAYIHNPSEHIPVCLYTDLSPILQNTSQSAYIHS